MKSLKLLILVPVYNEWPHLLPVLQKLKTHFSEILVIDDGSDDKSYLNLLIASLLHKATGANNDGLSRI